MLNREHKWEERKNNMKKIIIFLAFILSLNILAQGDAQAIVSGEFRVKEGLQHGSKSFSITFTDVDSLDLVGGMKSDVFDWSYISNALGDAPNFCYAYTSSSANDTLKCLLYGYDPLTANYNLLDTVGLTILSTTNGGTTTYGTFSLSTNGWSPFVQIRIIQKAATNDQADNGTFKIKIFGEPANPYDERIWK